MAISTVVFWISWVQVLTRVDPESAGFVGLFIFYVSLLFAIIGTFMLLGVLVRSLFVRHVPTFRHLGISLRQCFRRRARAVRKIVELGDPEETD